MHARTFIVVAITILSLTRIAAAGDYLITWKSTLPEGATNRCNIKVTGRATVAGLKLLKLWEVVNFPLNTEGVNYPLYMINPADLNDKISYSPVTGCAQLIVNIACHSKPSGDDWMRTLNISPCQDRTINVFVNDVRQE